MKAVYQIRSSSSAPRLTVVDPRASEELLRFDGRPKLDRWPKDGLKVEVSHVPPTLYAFFNLAPGLIVYQDRLLQECEDFSWVSCEGAELLPLQCGSMSLEGCHIVDSLPGSVPAPPGQPPCPVDSHYHAMFRIGNAASTELYCTSGVNLPQNEMKGVYDLYGMTGLDFVEIWREAPDAQ